jgi:hypothetical protein
MATLTHIVFHDYLEAHCGTPARWGPKPLLTYNANSSWDKYGISLARPYHVNFWASHPDAGNDDCNSGMSFATLDEAVAYFNENKDSDAFVELCLGANSGDVYDNRKPVRITLCEGVEDTLDAEDSGTWRLEIAREAGMLGGCDAYNEVMGY